jgi:multidrug efflux system outer membrane protein
MLGPDFQKPKYESPEHFRFDFGENDSLMINLRWWEILKDPMLDSLIKMALAENKDVLIAAQRIEAAKANIGYTKADQWPAFRYGVAVSGSNGTPSGTFNAYPELSWELGFWGKYRRMNEAARAGFVATTYAKQTIQLSLISAVASTYFTILASYNQYEISMNTLSSRDSGLIIMRDKYEGGLIPLMDLNQAQIQRDIAAAAVPTYKRLIALNENALNILLGRYPRAISRGIPFSDLELNLDIPVGIPSELLERRPDVKQAEALFEEQNAQIGVAEALRWPSISLTGLLGVASNDLTSITTYGLAWSAGASVFGPVFQFGKNKRRVEIAKANAQAALLQYENIANQSFKDVEDALVSIETYKEELIAQKSRTQTAIISEELAGIRYQEGTTTYLEVLEQQRQSFSAQLDLLANKLNLINSYIFLYKALGGGWLSTEEEQKFLNGK